MFWTDLFQALWSLGPSLEEQSHIIIPETVVFNGKNVQSWFFVPSASGTGTTGGRSAGTLLSKRLIRPGVRVDILESFIKQSAGSYLVASMIWFPSDLGVSSKKDRATSAAAQQPLICHLNAENLRALLLGTELVEVPEGPWILQAFLPPGSDAAVSASAGYMSTLTCDVPPGGGQIRPPVCRLYINRHQFAPHAHNSHSTIEARGADMANVQVVPRVNPRLQALSTSIAATCCEAVMCFGSNAENSGNTSSTSSSSKRGANRSMMMYLRQRGAKLYLLFASFSSAAGNKGSKANKRLGLGLGPGPGAGPGALTSSNTDLSPQQQQQQQTSSSSLPSPASGTEGTEGQEVGSALAPASVAIDKAVVPVAPASAMPSNKRRGKGSKGKGKDKENETHVVAFSGGPVAHLHTIFSSSAHVLLLEAISVPIRSHNSIQPSGDALGSPLSFTRAYNLRGDGVDIDTQQQRQQQQPALHVTYTGGADAFEELLGRYWRQVEGVVPTANNANTAVGGGGGGGSAPTGCIDDDDDFAGLLSAHKARYIFWTENEQRILAESSAYRLSTQYGISIKAKIKPLPADIRPLASHQVAEEEIEATAAGKRPEETQQANGYEQVPFRPFSSGSKTRQQHSSGIGTDSKQWVSDRWDLSFTAASAAEMEMAAIYSNKVDMRTKGGDDAYSEQPNDCSSSNGSGGGRGPLDESDTLATTALDILSIVGGGSPQSQSASAKAAAAAAAAAASGAGREGGESGYAHEMLDVYSSFDPLERPPHAPTRPRSSAAAAAAATRSALANAGTTAHAEEAKRAGSAPHNGSRGGKSSKWKNSSPRNALSMAPAPVPVMYHPTAPSAQAHGSDPATVATNQPQWTHPSYTSYIDKYGARIPCAPTPAAPPRAARRARKAKKQSFAPAPTPAGAAFESESESATNAADDADTAGQSTGPSQSSDIAEESANVSAAAAAEVAISPSKSSPSNFEAAASNSGATPPLRSTSAMRPSMLFSSSTKEGGAGNSDDDDEEKEEENDDDEAKTGKKRNGGSGADSEEGEEGEDAFVMDPLQFGAFPVSTQFNSKTNQDVSSNETSPSVHDSLSSATAAPESPKTPIVVPGPPAAARTRKPGRMTIMERGVSKMHRPQAPTAGSVSANAKKAENALALDTSPKAIPAVAVADKDNDDQDSASGSGSHSTGERREKVQGIIGATGSTPPAQAEHLVDVLVAIVSAVCESFSTSLVEAEPFAKEHREGVTQHNKGAAAEAWLDAQESPHSPENNGTIGSPLSGQLVGAASAGVATLNPTAPFRSQLEVAKIVRHLQLSSASANVNSNPFATAAAVTSGNQHASPSGDKKSGATDATSLKSKAMASEAASLKLRPQAEHFSKALEMLLTAPNARPPDQLSNILAWLLSCTDPASQHSSLQQQQQQQQQQKKGNKKILKQMLKGFKKVSTFARIQLAQFTASQCNRGSYPVAPTKKATPAVPATIQSAKADGAKHTNGKDAAATAGFTRISDLATAMRAWTSNVLEERPLESSSSGNAAASGGAKAAGGNKAAGVTSAVSVSTPRAYKPVAGQSIIPLPPQIEEDDARVKNSDECATGAATNKTGHYKGRSYTGGATASGPATSESQLQAVHYRRVRCHDIMLGFLNSLHWKIPFNLVPVGHVPASSLERVSVTGTLAPLLDKFWVAPTQAEEQMEKAVDTDAVPTPHTSRQTIKKTGSDEESPKRSIAIEHMTSPTVAAVVVKRESANSLQVVVSSSPTRPVSATDAQNPEMGFSSPSRTPTYTPASPAAFPSSPLSSLIPLERVATFFATAPTLSDQQRNMLIIALISDVARSALLHVFKLVRYTWSGKRLQKSEVESVLGRSLVQAIGVQSLDSLCYWLNANCRSKCSFKLGNESLVECAIHRMYSFWPSLALALHEAMASRATVTCTLQWPDRASVEAVFKEPHTFRCNANVI